MCIFKMPKAPTVTPPTKRETMDVETGALEARAEQRRRAALARGYQSTKLSGSGGVGEQAPVKKTLLGQ